MGLEAEGGRKISSDRVKTRDGEKSGEKMFAEVREQGRCNAKT